MNGSNIWIEGTCLYMKRSDSTWEAEGVLEGPSVEPSGSLWIEVGRIAYVDAFGNKRTIPLVPQGTTDRPYGFLALHPYGYLWYAAKDGKRLGITHNDVANAYWSDHSDIDAYTGEGYIDIPSHDDYINHFDHADNAHSDKLTYEQYHLDSVHRNEHSNWSDIDTYTIRLDYSDQMRLNVTSNKSYEVRSPHADNIHQDWSDNYDRPHSDVSHADYADHDNISHSNRAHSDVSYADYADHDNISYSDTDHSDRHADYSDTIFGEGHVDSHGDVSHSDVPYVDWSDNYDRPHSDVSHSDVPYVDWSDNYDRPHSDVSHADHIDYEDVAHGNFYYVDAYHDDHSDTIDESVYIDHGNFGPYDHLDTTHGDAPSGEWSDHYDRPHSDNLYVDLPHDDHSDKSYIGSSLHDDHNDYGPFDHNDSYIDIPSGEWNDHNDVHMDYHYLDHSHADYEDISYGSGGRHDDHANAPSFDEQRYTHMDTTHADIKGYSDIPYGDGGGHADEGEVIERVDYSDSRTWSHGDYVDHANMSHLDNPRRVS